MRLQRDAFELSELAERWGISAADIRFLVANDRMRLSVRLVAQPVQICEQEGEGEWVPVREAVVTGLADLALKDAFKLVRDGAAQVGQVYQSETRLLTLRGGDGIAFTLADLVVRCPHAEDLERELIGVPVGRKDAFDFRLFVYDGQEFAFTVPQARALQFVLDQTRAGAPDQHHVDILKAVGSSSQRLNSLFSRKPYWTRLLRKTSGRRGWYHFNPEFVVWLIANA
jgi:hypothetical protein